MANQKFIDRISVFVEDGFSSSEKILTVKLVDPFVALLALLLPPLGAKMEGPAKSFFDLSTAPFVIATDRVFKPRSNDVRQFAPFDRPVKEVDADRVGRFGRLFLEFIGRHSQPKELLGTVIH